MSVDRMHSFVDTVKVPDFQSLKNIIRNFHFYFPTLSTELVMTQLRPAVLRGTRLRILAE